MFKYYVLAIALAVTVGSDSIASTVWDQMQNPDVLVNANSIPALQNPQLSNQMKQDLLAVCMNSLTETQIIDPGQIAGAVRAQEGLQAGTWSTTRADQIRNECSGTVGETMCLQQAYSRNLNECIEVTMAKARIQKGL